MTTTITRGSRVAFSRKFLQSTAQYTGPDSPTSYGPFARGMLLRVLDGWQAEVLWDDGHTSHANIRNLIREDRIHLEPV